MNNDDLHLQGNSRSKAASAPVGLQIVGPRYAGALVLRAARAFESAMPIRLPEVAGLGQASR
jgi:Asp-tRNA(Asn)/Glu-tRNA(Gln) amidotransferase A subunit family amidase